MPWARFDDNFPDHPKVADLTDRTFRLLVAMICHCARNNTDGHVKRADVPRLIRGYSAKHLAELVRKGNVHESGHACPDPLCADPAESEVFVHGYLERNRSKERIEADRAAAAKRKADFLAKKKAEKEAKEVRNAAKNGVPNGARNASPAQPNPTQPVGHWVGVSGSQANESPPSPSAGDDEERVVLPDVLADIRKTKQKLREPRSA